MCWLDIKIKKNNPWNIQIENGTGKIERNKSGGKYCKRGSFICEAEVSINLSDQDFFAFFARTNASIEAFEHDQMSRRRNAQNFKVLYKKMEKLLLENQEERYAA